MSVKFNNKWSEEKRNDIFTFISPLTFRIRTCVINLENTLQFRKISHGEILERKNFSVKISMKFLRQENFMKLYHHYMDEGNSFQREKTYFPEITYFSALHVV